MEMSSWLEYYTEGLATQMQEVRQLGEQAIKKDIISSSRQLNDRQQKALTFLLKHDRMSIQDFERICPSSNRRTLQRDLKDMGDKDLVFVEGKTNQKIYRLKKQ